MPYISADERPALDKKVGALADELSSTLARGENKETEISVIYKDVLVAIGRALLELERGKAVKAPGHAKNLAVEIFKSAGNRESRGAWLGRLNYSLTRLIQEVPAKMVEKGVWKDEFRYWLYALTVGALARAAMEVNGSEGDGWPIDGVVGVLVDVKDEYKRRVNTAYEMVQIRKAGDCYTTPYHTELGEVKDSSGKVVGYTEVMKDFRKRY
ncbi:MAG TPA: hypothetical protein VLY65_00705 [Nitrososphaerales archaeon]|nr:hypothetical protein [Nitrososphaerales archaeon]